MRRLAPLALALAALGGCGGPYANEPAPTPSAAPAAPSDLERAARGYAELARTWTPQTLRQQYRRQLAATTGPLRGALRKAGVPSDLEIRAAAEDHQSATATAESVEVKQTGNRAQGVVLLHELATSTDVVTPSTRPYTVQLRRTAGRWLVTDFTAAP